MRPFREADLTVDDRNLWALLGSGGGTDGWQGKLPACGRWSTLVVIERARESQLDALHAAASDGMELPRAVACIALEGDGFKGQRDRAWSALRGNLHLSTLCATDLDARRTAAELTMIPAVAIAEAIHARCRPRVEPAIKWVNDVLIDGKKVAGVLTRTHVQHDRFVDVTFGAGINVAASPILAATRLFPPAGCLTEFLPADRVRLDDLLIDVLVRIGVELDRLATVVGGSDGELLLCRYRRFSSWIGKRVDVWADPENTAGAEVLVASGRLIAIEPDLGLRLEGHPAPVFQGRLTLTDEKEG